MTLYRATSEGNVPMSAEEEAAIRAEWDANAARVIVPREVTRRQARQALLLAGLLDDVQTAIDAVADATERALVQIWWDDALDFQRDHPMVIGIGTAMGLTSADLDQLFTVAKTL